MSSIDELSKEVLRVLNILVTVSEEFELYEGEADFADFEKKLTAKLYEASLYLIKANHQYSREPEKFEKALYGVLSNINNVKSNISEFIVDLMIARSKKIAYSFADSEWALDKASYNGDLRYEEILKYINGLEDILKNIKKHPFNQEKNIASLFERLFPNSSPSVFVYATELMRIDASAETIKINSEIYSKSLEELKTENVKLHNQLAEMKKEQNARLEEIKNEQKSSNRFGRYSVILGLASIFLTLAGFVGGYVFRDLVNEVSIEKQEMPTNEKIIE